MSPNDVINETARISDMPREDFTIISRDAAATEIRHLATWGICQLQPKLTHQQVGRYFGFSSTSNVGYAVKKASNLADVCPKFRAMRDRLKAFLQGGES
jgi:hypothetical protein